MSAALAAAAAPVASGPGSEIVAFEMSPLSARPKQRFVEAYELIEVRTQYCMVLEGSKVVGMKEEQVPFGRQYFPDYVQLQENGADKLYSYHIVPGKLEANRLHMMVPVRSGMIAGRAGVLFRTIESQYFPPSSPLNQRFKFCYVHLDEEPFMHVSVPADFRATCEKVIAQCGLTICTHKSTETKLVTGVSVIIPNAPYLLQFCEPTMRDIHLPMRDKTGCTEAEMAELEALTARVRAMNVSSNGAAAAAAAAPAPQPSPSPAAAGKK